MAEGEFTASGFSKSVRAALAENARIQKANREARARGQVPSCV